jgi:amino acid transporter
MRVLAWIALAPAGVAVGLGILALQNHYVPGEPLNASHTFWTWVLMFVWVACCGAGVFYELRGRRR